VVRLWYARRVKVFFLVEHELSKTIPVSIAGNRINLENIFNFNAEVVFGCWVAVVLIRY
jgi:hypothetical protein